MYDLLVTDWETSKIDLFLKKICGRRSIKDEVREDPPKTAVASENIDEVRELIMQGPRVTFREIEASLEYLQPAYIQYCMNTWP